MIPEPSDATRAVPVPKSCETDQEIWLRVQQMMKGSDIRIQEKKANLFSEWERFTSTDVESIESYYYRFSKLMNDFKRNKHFLKKIANGWRKWGNQFRQYVGKNVGNQVVHNAVRIGCLECWKSKWVILVPGIANQNGNGNVVAARAEGNVNGNNAYLQTQLLIAQKEEARIHLQAEEFDLMAAAVDLDKIEEVNANFIFMANVQEASTLGTQSD
nr:hypothetical protein [Tanacetum cinerariifolium]